MSLDYWVCQMALTALFTGDFCYSSAKLSKVPTILVPGFGDGVTCMGALERYLHRTVGPAVTLSPQPSDGRLGIDELAQILATQIEQTIVSGQSFNLVGFSMGGLICRYYLQYLAQKARVERLITIASPHRGTWSAYLFSSPACLQMRPGSQFLQRLNCDLSVLEVVAFSSLWSPFDLTILPAISSWLPVGEIVTIASPFHRTMVLDPQILHAVSVRLKRQAATSL